MARSRVHSISAVLAVALAACSPPKPSAAPAAPPAKTPSPAPAREPAVDNPLQSLVATAMALQNTLDVAMVLAAPRAARQRGSMPTRAEVLAVLDEYLRVLREHSDIIADDGPVASALEPLALRLRELVAAWTPSPDVPKDIQLAARAVVSAMGVSAPPNGWDAVEEIRDREPPSAPP